VVVVCLAIISLEGWRDWKNIAFLVVALLAGVGVITSHVDGHVAMNRLVNSQVGCDIRSPGMFPAVLWGSSTP
jgi:hypothetical protein